MTARHGALALSADGARTTNDEGDWKRAHAALSRLARERAELDAEEGRWLLSALRSSAHVHLGFASFAEYVERLFGYRPRTTQEKLRVAEALEGLPRLARALEAGELGWCAARELTRVAVAENESAWLETARGKTQRELEALVANKSRGDAPDGPPTERPRLRVLRFEVTPETFASFREAMLKTRRQAGGRLDDDALLLAMARHVLGGPHDDGRASYQVSLQVCASCGAGAQPAASELVPVDAAITGMALCDAQHLGEPLPPAAPPPVRARPAANENALLDAPLEATPSAGGAAHESSDHAHVSVENRQPSDAGNAPGDTPLGTTSPAATPRREPATAHCRPSRARQTIPPALRRAVLARDRRRCTVPGCTHSSFVDVHHVQPRSEGGRHGASNLLTLCSAHHRAAHRGELLIEREADATLRFHHADGTAYGTPLEPARIDAHAKVFSALCHLGFRESAVKAVLRELRADAELAASAEHLLREALRRIRPTAR